MKLAEIAKKAINKPTPENIRELPGFDEIRHNSGLVTESVEVRNGRRVVVYRATPEIMKDINEEFRRRLQIKNSTSPNR